MITEERIKSREDIFLYNLSKLKGDSAAINEEMRLLLYSFCSSLILPEMSFDRAAKNLLELCQKISKANGTENANLALEKTVVCQVLAERFPEIINRQKFFLQSPLSSQIKTAKIAFWKGNRLSHQGFEQFSMLFSSAKALVSESFSEVCEQVVGQTSDFGILPIENTTDGRLSVFYKMLDKNDLKICAVCDVEDMENDTQTRLALISKSVSAIESDLPRFLEFSFVSSDRERLRELLSVAEYFRTDLIRLSSLPISYRSEVGIDTVTFALKNETVLPYLIYLHLFFEDANILGFFVQL